MLSEQLLPLALANAERYLDHLPTGTQATYMRCLVVATPDGWGHAACFGLLRAVPRLIRADVDADLRSLASVGLISLHRPADPDADLSDLLRRSSSRKPVPSIPIRSDGRLPRKLLWKIEVG